MFSLLLKDLISAFYLSVLEDLKFTNRATIKGSLGVIYSQKSSSNFQMLMIRSENFVTMKNMQNKTD